MVSIQGGNMKKIKDFMNKCDNYMVAISFAEAGEFDTARQIINKKFKISVICSGSKEDNYAIKYAVSLAKRVNGILKIFINEAISKNLIKQFEEEVSYEILNFSNFSDINHYIEESDLITIADEKLLDEISVRDIPLIFVQPNKNL
ncbi:MAG: hypothetical protein QXZ22_08260 [Sulfolobales archaeon]